MTTKRDDTLPSADVVIRKVVSTFMESVRQSLIKETTAAEGATPNMTRLAFLRALLCGIPSERDAFFERHQRPHSVFEVVYPQSVRWTNGQRKPAIPDDLPQIQQLAELVRTLYPAYTSKEDLQKQAGEEVTAALTGYARTTPGVNAWGWMHGQGENLRVQEVKPLSAIAGKPSIVVEAWTVLPSGHPLGTGRVKFSGTVPVAYQAAYRGVVETWNSHIAQVSQDISKKKKALLDSLYYTFLQALEDSLENITDDERVLIEVMRAFHAKQSAPIPLLPAPASAAQQEVARIAGECHLANEALGNTRCRVYNEVQRQALAGRWFTDESPFERALPTVVVGCFLGGVVLAVLAITALTLTIANPIGFALMIAAGALCG